MEEQKGATGPGDLAWNPERGAAPPLRPRAFLPLRPSPATFLGPVGGKTVSAPWAPLLTSPVAAKWLQTMRVWMAAAVFR